MERRRIRSGGTLLIAPPDSNSDRHRKEIERWFRELREPVIRYLRTIGCEVSLAEEITQEVFFRLHRALREGLQVKDARPWVFRVARNLFIDSCREHQRFWSGRPEDGEEFDLSHTDSSPDPEQQVLERERIRIIQREVMRLPRPLRESMYLRAQGLQYHEIAIALDISMTTAVDRVRRAIKKLGRRFGDFK
jgi:RNA polymerase sigma-70 factor (ECF subfamily)